MPVRGENKQNTFSTNALHANYTYVCVRRARAVRRVIVFISMGPPESYAPSRTLMGREAACCREALVARRFSGAVSAIATQVPNASAMIF